MERSTLEEIDIHLKDPHEKQGEFRDYLLSGERGLRCIICAGRRSGKTTGIAEVSVEAFMKGGRVLYTAPTSDQTNAYWAEVTESLRQGIDSKVYDKNETERIIELPETRQRIRAKTAWNADMMRGDWGDLLIYDEFQLTNEEAWTRVGAPMLLDHNGNAVFIFTPPSLHSRSASKADDPQHALKMFRAKSKDPRWRCFHFTSHDNPHISQQALSDITEDMTALAHRQEIMAEDIDEAPGALWTRETIEKHRWNGRAHPDLFRIVVGVDPPGGATECGIVAAGIGLCDCRGEAEPHMFVLDDASLQAGPHKWAQEVSAAYHRHHADRVLGEKNYGGDMVESTIKTADPDLVYRAVSATRGKAVRAEPIAAKYEQGKVHHVGTFSALEDEQCGWEPGHGAKSPNRLDALVWCGHELLLGKKGIRFA